MALSDLIAARSSSTPLDEPSVPAGPTEAVIPAAASDEGSSSGDEEARVGSTGGSEGDGSESPEEPSPPDTEEKAYGVAEQEHPSGICVYFQAGPKRLYRLRGKATTSSGDHYTPWKEVPSVSTVLDILEKGGLPWWGMRVGVDGVLKLIEEGVIRWNDSWSSLVTDNPDAQGTLIPATTERIVGKKELGIKGLLTQHRLTVNHVRDAAGDRGTNVHTALELWATQGIAPQPAVYAPEEQGYVSALRDFLIDSGLEAVRSEVQIGSMKHKFAGRYDLEGLIPNNAEIVVRSFPKTASIRTKFPGGLYLLDLKTSAEVYDTHFIQLEGYEAGRIECGYDPSLYRGVIHVEANGKYELRLNLQHNGNIAGPEKYLPLFEKGKPLVTFADFKHVMATAKALERIKGRK